MFYDLLNFALCLVNLVLLHYELKGYLTATWGHGSQPVWRQHFNRLWCALANERKIKTRKEEQWMSEGVSNSLTSHNIPVAMRATCVYFGTGPGA